MSTKSDPAHGVNSWLEEELYAQYLHDQGLVDPSWKAVFDREGSAPKPNGEPDRTAVREEPRPAAKAASAVTLAEGEELVPLKGAANRIAENMEVSLTVPTATSQRSVPVKVIDENRRIINAHLEVLGRGKVSYTHLIAWAIVKALAEFPALNNAYAMTVDGPCRLVRKHINFGLAVDVAGKDGSRSLMVPNIKNAGALGFHEFLTAFDDIVSRARMGKLTVDDFRGTTISLTNPGTVGTVGSIPRLMAGQGAIIATGIIDYPPGFQGANPETLAMLGVSKVMMVTCTYDHRIIQGAESGMFLGRVHALLQGEDAFYERMFADLQLPYRPVRWQEDRAVFAPGRTGHSEEVAKEAAVIQLINAYRVRGHLIADLDPLGSQPGYHPELDPANYGLTIWDLDRTFFCGTLGNDDIEDIGDEPEATLRQILERLRKTYSGKIGCQYMQIQDTEQKRWLQRRMEPEANNWPLEPEVRKRVLEHLLEAEGLEHFLHTRFVGQKRFSLEGSETTLSVLDAMLDLATRDRVEEVVIGMAHRGRLNVLANIVGKPLTQIFSEFEGDPDPLSTQGSGDVKYHLGATGTFHGSSGELLVSVAPNPSHLEAVDPVVEGIVRSKQDVREDKQRTRVIPILVHGDAAFAGQGVVAETLNLSQLQGYRTGGTVHVVINNQIGFTTHAHEGRSSAYSTDVARLVQAPIFHVNADDPEAAIRVAQIVFDFRQKFKKDVVIDLICYRRHGHNEGDDPSYTQPLMYRKIRHHPSTATLYSERLIREKVLAAGDIQQMKDRIAARLEEAYQRAQKKGERFEIQELSTVAFDPKDIRCESSDTAISREHAARIVEGLTRLPAGFRLHPKLERFLERRRETITRDAPVDWAMAEAIAFGSLIEEGTPVRLSGQDSARGTFSQRHSTFYDWETGEPHRPLQWLKPGQSRFYVYDSSLSEYAVLGFEFGYSIGNPFALVLWEAQFGDFVNGAQIMVDQFITCSEQKWGQPSGVVLLLPHGYEGQGPEHSSGRIERFLILCAEGNIQVANCTTPAQYFHILRRQIYGGPDRRGLRKPLVLFTPKSLLRHKDAVSPLEDLTSGRFQEVLPDTAVDPKKVKRGLFCSGKIYYELLAKRQELRADWVAVNRLEQLYPFPDELMRETIARYPHAKEWIWVQEEPRNMGPWRFMQEWIDPILDPSGCRQLAYVGRPRSASPAGGSLKRHVQHQAKILEESFAPLRPATGNRRR